ncbi:hypothetical protein Ddc_17687 [Ditylenchus destructor]|nr:hypothetical protein Ddc_17687 [Ditylenchus destructor]
MYGNTHAVLVSATDWYRFVCVRLRMKQAKLKSTIYLSLFTLFLLTFSNVNCIVSKEDPSSSQSSGTPQTSLSIDEVAEQEKSHRHPETQLEPDLASSIFDAAKQNVGKVNSAASSNGNTGPVVPKNPLERTTTMPNAQHLDAGSAGPVRGRRSAPAVHFTEYDAISADFNNDEEQSETVNKEEPLPFEHELSNKPQTDNGHGVQLANSEVSVQNANNSPQVQELKSSVISQEGAEAIEQAPIQKSQDTRKQLFEKLEKESAQQPQENPAIDNLSAQADVVDAKDFANNRKVTEITTTAATTTTSAAVFDTTEGVHFEDSRDEKSDLEGDFADQMATTTTLLPTRSADDYPPFGLVDRSVNKRQRTILTNFVDPALARLFWRVKRQVETARVKRADEHSTDYVDLGDISHKIMRDSVNNHTENHTDLSQGHETEIPEDSNLAPNLKSSNDSDVFEIQEKTEAKEDHKIDSKISEILAENNSNSTLENFSDQISEAIVRSKVPNESKASEQFTKLQEAQEAADAKLQPRIQEEAERQTTTTTPEPKTQPQSHVQAQTESRAEPVQDQQFQAQFRPQAHEGSIQRQQFRLSEINSGERPTVDRSQLKVGLKLVPSTVTPTIRSNTLVPNLRGRIAPGQVIQNVFAPQVRTPAETQDKKPNIAQAKGSDADGLFKDLPSGADNAANNAADAIIGTEGGSDKDLGLQRIAPPSSSASIGTASSVPGPVAQQTVSANQGNAVAQPQFAAQPAVPPRQVQENHFLIGRQRFIIKSVPADQWQQQSQQWAWQQQQLEAQRQQQVWQQQVQQQQQLAWQRQQQPVPVQPPLSAPLSTASVAQPPPPQFTNARGVADTDIPRPAAQPPVQRPAQIPQRQPFLVPQVTPRPAPVANRVPQTPPAVRVVDHRPANIQTTIRATIATTVPTVATPGVPETTTFPPTQRPETNNRVRVAEGEVYDEVGPLEGNPSSKRSRRLATKAKPIAEGESEPVKIKFTTLLNNDDSDILNSDQNASTKLTSDAPQD